MYLKLHFNTGIQVNYAFNLLNYAIRNSASVTANSFNSGSFATNLANTGYDSTKSEVITTVKPTNVESFWYAYRSSGENSSAQYRNNFLSMLKFKAHDDPNQVYYLEFRDSWGTGTSSFAYMQQAVGTVLSKAGNTNFNTPSDYFTGGPNWSTMYGTDNYNILSSPNLNGLTENALLGQMITQDLKDINTFFAYVTDTTFVWAATRAENTITGFTAAGNLPNVSKYIGPFVFTQYTRDDAFNTSNNGIVPLTYHNWVNAQSGTAASNSYGGMFHSTGHMTVPSDNPVIKNTIYDYCPMILYNGRDMSLTNTPPSGNGYLYHMKSNLSTGNFDQNGTYGLLENPGVNTSTPTNAVSNSTNHRSYITYNSTYASQYRVPNSTLTGIGFRMAPFGVYNNYYNITGGSITELSGLRLFSGNFLAGDVIQYQGKRYSIWPFFYTNLTYYIGLAVPKE